MSCLPEILKVNLGEQLLIEYYVIKHYENTMGIKEVLLQWFMNFSKKKTSGGAVKN